ncbi:hypothetical protein GCM10011315_24220 [Roseovarius pacificus]|nr:hypothetical protein GCM10011315_24220 [Roseovarius pacificus]
MVVALERRRIEHVAHCGFGGLGKGAKIGHNVLIEGSFVRWQGQGAKHTEEYCGAGHLAPLVKTRYRPVGYLTEGKNDVRAEESRAGLFRGA